MRPVLGSWYVTDQGAAGIGVRESDGPITGNLSRFVPHFFD
jgi:glutathionylspermidine synthase